MTDDSEPQHRAYHRAAPEQIVREDEDGDEEGVFRVRMPIATTGEVRNQGDDPLTRDELDGMSQQISDRSISVFGDHGKNPDLAGSRYSAFEALGEWEEGSVQSREVGDEDELVATARLMDPDTMSESTGALREGLARLKAQTDRGMSLSSSIGWRDDDASPGGVDLMETSIVGIGADPRTTSHDAGVEMARVAQALDDTDADPEQLVEDFRAVVMGPEQTQNEDKDDEMTDESTENEADDESADTQNEESDSISGDEFRSQMLEMQRNQTETLSSLADALRADDDDDEEGDGEDEDEDEDEDDESGGENDADSEDAGERMVEIDGEERVLEDVVADLREQAFEADAQDGESKTETRGESDGSDESEDGKKAGFGFAGAE